MYVLAIDFGTSTTVGMVRLPDGRVRPLLFDGSPLLPSGVYLGTDGRLLVGRDAVRQARLDPGRFEPYPKRRIDDSRIRLGGRRLRAFEVVGAVLAHVARESYRVIGGYPSEVRLTHPVHWHSRKQTAALLTAARVAGLTGVRLVAEPVAAASYVTAVLGHQVPAGRCLAIYDLGGGSFDATVVRRTPAGFEVLANESLPDVGGIVFDDAITGYLRATYGWAPPGEDARSARELLSRTETAHIHLQDLRMDVGLTRADLERMIHPYLDRTVRTLARVIATAGMRPQDLAGVLLVGGSSGIPMVASLVRSALGVTPMVLEQPGTVVAEGALYLGSDVPAQIRRSAQPPVFGPAAGPASGAPAYRPPDFQPQPSSSRDLTPTGGYRQIDPGVLPPVVDDPGPGYGIPETPTERHFIGELPARVRIGQEFSVIVEIRGRPADPGQHGQPLRIVADRSGTPLWIIVRVDPGLEVLANSEDTMFVWPDRDSTPARFALRAHTPGLHTVRVSAWSGGTFLAELNLQTSAAVDRVDADPRRVSVAMGSTRPRGGEATLLVEVEGGRYSFRWLTEGFLSSRALTEPLAGPPDAAVARTVETLRRIVEQESGYSPSNARRWVTETGVGLWQDMVPDPIKEQYWQLRHMMRALHIACADDWMPWELLYPRAPRRDDGFLVQQLPVLRQVTDQLHSPVVHLGGARCVVPPNSPTNAKEEVDAVRRTLLGAGVDGISDRDIDSLDDLLDMLDSGSTGLLHFACHNGYSVESGGSFIRMAGGNFVPALLNSIRTDATLARMSPLIFLNACRSAGIAPYYTRMMGWAEQFMSAGAGAFVGTLWPVETGRAAGFAEAFYASLLAGDTLGVAGLRARRAIEDPADPSWLAYTIYGNPNAVATFGK